MRLSLALLLILVFLQINGCWGNTSLPPIGDVTEIVVKDRYENTKNNEYKIIKKITDPGQISKIVAFFNHRLNGWSDLAVGRIGLQFRNHERFVASFGIGKDFLDAPGHSKMLSQKEIEEIVNLLGIDKSLTLRPNQ